MLDCKAMVTPMISNLKLLQVYNFKDYRFYLIQANSGLFMCLTNIRTDICFVVNTLSQHLEYPRQDHLVVSKHVLRYLKGTLDHGLWYIFDHEFGFYGYQIQIGLTIFLTRKALPDTV
jgi:hypothetical protein